ncbi:MULTISPECIES: DUF402 domain-containing protein [unclassified Mycoplasma]|uniref:DUF402 domain-containing protein n=1 Tax=unclassified Mycoplasma TaxID=2683645 RepID=UPI00211CAB5E|nr:MULTISPECIES: DUF402 domain-containing protein [unclassified Mycoplasma]UUM19868.1 DUF402 domain-containing protein [Mycoplasma sp. 1578d]UUM24852.1 DUF402 domain-containing protein [Mycoplasma sp. 3686d]
MEREFKNLKVGQIINVQGYKFNGFLYRQWNSAKVIFNNSRHIVLFLHRTKVSDYNKKINYWRYSENALWFFPKNSYFNAILLLKRNSKIYHYINLASKPVFEDETIKFIDFDLDIKCYPGKDIQLVDRDEFLKNSVLMKYPVQFKKTVFDEITRVFELYANYKYFFNPQILGYYVDILYKDKLIEKKFYDNFIKTNVQEYSDEFSMFSDLMKK